jgi:hypothetical protein
MTSPDKQAIEHEEILIWTIEGYEGRFVEWQTDLWQAIDYRNYRHWFSPAQPLRTEDVRVLRETFHVPADILSDEQLIHTPPGTLRRIRPELSDT